MKYKFSSVLGDIRGC